MEGMIKINQTKVNRKDRMKESTVLRCMPSILLWPEASRADISGQQESMHASSLTALTLNRVHIKYGTDF